MVKHMPLCTSWPSRNRIRFLIEDCMLEYLSASSFSGCGFGSLPHPAFLVIPFLVVLGLCYQRMRNVLSAIFLENPLHMHSDLPSWSSTRVSQYSDRGSISNGFGHNDFGTCPVRRALWQATPLLPHSGAFR